MIPDVPTAADAGFPELSFDGLVGFFGPPGMALDLRERIAQDVRAVTEATVKQRLLATGQVPNFGGPSEFAAATDAQRARLAEIAKQLGIKPSQ